MTRVVTVVDYGVGNLFSIARSIEKAGGEARLSADPDEVAGAERLLLPGVGAFGACAAQLASAGMAGPVKAFAATGRPFLGICVGMQLLFDRSFEFGEHAGLGLIPGSVEAIPSDGRKVPHIGWNALLPSQVRGGWAGTIFEALRPGEASAYFVHSFAGHAADPADVLSVVDYAGAEVCAAVQRGNICGVQFHPEKSGPVGLALLDAYLRQ
jgi:glutamine amidotransferase